MRRYREGESWKGGSKSRAAGFPEGRAPRGKEGSPGTERGLGKMEEHAEMEHAGEAAGGSSFSL